MDRVDLLGKRWRRAHLVFEREQLRETQHRIQRRSQLVADARQKLALVFARNARADAPALGPRPQGFEQGRGQLVGEAERHGDSGMGNRQRGLFAHRIIGQLGLGQQPLAAFEQGTPGVGQPERPQAAIEQLRADPGLEPGDRLRHR